MSNPFFHGNPVSPDQFLDRRRELRRLASRIVNQGQSTAVIGEPRSGKTSLLAYLAAPETRAELYGADADRTLFTYLDAQTLGARFSQAQFWEYALRPLQEQAVGPAPDSPLAKACAICQENGFGTFVLERLLAQMEQAGWRLVLMLDEFDVLLHHPTLNRAEFFGSLRSLASRSRGALALVLASRRPLESLNRETQELSRTGSPFFNIFAEINLGPWPEKAVEEFLHWAEDRFSAGDRRFIKGIAGGHPYLLQAAASALWEAYEDEGRDAHQRWQQAGLDLYAEVAQTLGEMWRFWGPRMRQAFISVTLAHVDTLASRADHVHPDQYSLAAIRNLLRDAFTDKGLRRFCLDRPIFSEIASRFGSGWSLEDMNDALIEYCQRRLLFGELLSEIQDFNPRQYGRYEPQLVPDRLLGPVSLLAELRCLERQGCVARDEAVLGGWRVRPLVLLWWLADELARATSSPRALREWLQAQALDSVLSAEEKQRLGEAGPVIGGLFTGGVPAFIEAAAREG